MNPSGEFDRKPPDGSYRMLDVVNNLFASTLNGYLAGLAGANFKGGGTYSDECDRAVDAVDRIDVSN
jgi:hypothetical protein